MPLSAIPILRIFDQAKAYEFYRDFLGFEVVWEHRFGDDMPLYAEVALDGVRLHLSEHYGDASPGGAAIIEIEGARAFQRRLLEANHPNARPGVEQEEWGLVVSVHDPFHNRLMFLQHTAPPRQERVGGAEGAEGVKGVEGAGDANVEPIRHSVTVPATPATAFAAFTGDLARWWDPRLTADASTFHSVVMPPRAGGDVKFMHEGGQRYRIGTITEWTPGARFAMSFCLSLDPATPTTLTVDFVASPDAAQAGAGDREGAAPDPGNHGARTEVTLVHGGWARDNLADRGKFTQWPQLLQRYAASVSGRRATG